MEQLVGQTLDRYRLDSLLGTGNFGAVFKAHDLKLKRDVAVKVIDPRFTGAPNFQARFEEGTGAMARLDYRGIIEIFDFGQTRSLWYVVMELLEGDNLLQMLQQLHRDRRWIELKHAIPLVRQVSLAVHYAHQHGITQQDVRPNNIMFKHEPSAGLPYQVILTDLGTNGLLGPDWREHLSPSALPFLAPEEALGQPAGIGSNIYSLGVLLYVLTVQNVPVIFKTLADAVAFHQTQSAPSPRSIRRDLPQAIAEVIMKAMAKDPAGRFPDAAAFAAALAQLTQQAEQAEQTEPTTAVEAEAPQPEAPQGATIIIRIPDGETRLVPIHEKSVIIGRDQENQITLDFPNISRRHAQVIFDGESCRVIDLGSTNGTYLDQLKLVPRRPAPWRPDQIVRLGDIRLQLQLGEAPPSPPPPSAQEKTLVAGDRGQIEIVVEPVQLLVTPGQPTTATVTIINGRPEGDTFRISAEGIQPGWVLDMPRIVELPAEHQQTVKLTIQPPLSPQTRAGRHRLTIRAVGQNAPERAVEVTRTLTVAAYSQFDSTLWPEVIKAGQRGQVTVENRGNAPQGFTIAFLGQDDKLTFSPPEGHLRVAAGKSTLTEFQVDARRPRLVGGRRNHAYTVRISSGDGILQTRNGTVVSSGWVPVWALSIVVLLCLVLGLAGTFAYNIQNSRIQGATITARAIAEAPKATETAQEGARQATIQAATATTTYLQQDDDRDGLTNGDELERNTLLNKRDTDEDGLHDGDEVKRGTDPLRPDSDSDGLKDGDEVSRGIDPLKADTDGDGTPDATDPDPGRLPTATPGATATPTPINAPPVVSISEPAAGATFLAPANITLVANPADNDGRIAKVDFFAGPVLIGSVNSSPFRLTWRDVPGGNYAITAIATDNAGATATSATINITVSQPANVSPTINISEPLSGATFEAGGNVLIAAIAEDIDGRVVEVQFYAGTTLLDISTSRRTRYEYVWRNLTPGDYALSAIAIDDDEAETTSALVNITVNEPPNLPPTIDLITPQNGETFISGSPIVLTAAANDVDGTVTRVDFFADGAAIGAAGTSPYTITWTGATSGTHVLTADATDDDGETSTSSAVTITAIDPSPNTRRDFNTDQGVMLALSARPPTFHIVTGSSRGRRLVYPLE